MMNSLDESELQSTISQINAEVMVFEHRAERLARWKLGSLLTGTTVAIAENSLGTGAAASVISSWLYEILEHKIPATVRNELEDARNMLLGLTTGSTLDAVIVSRSRQSISKK